MNEISNTINKLTGKAFVLVSTNRQIKNGTLIFKDLFQKGVEYGIYGKSGYVRKRNIGPIMPSRWYRENGLWRPHQWWQLNPTSRLTTSYGAVRVKRILLPGQYDTMAKIILRVAKKSRAKS